jgi:hypothetical protein
MGDVFNDTVGRGLAAGAAQLHAVGCSLYGPVGPGPACVKAAQRRIRETGFPQAVKGCGLGIVGASGGFFSTKGLPGRLARQVFKTNLITAGAACLEGGA